MTILYVHGFASAGSSGTATHLRNMLYEAGVKVVSPDIPTSPLAAIAFLMQTVNKVNPDLILATSMGALFAEQIKGYPRILVNPSFCMARLLTFRGFGKRQAFRNKRQDGAKDFMVDKTMIDEYKEVERNSFKKITPKERNIVWGLFGTQDKNVNCQREFKTNYNNEHFILFEGEHFLNDTVLKHVVLPVIKEILHL